MLGDFNWGFWGVTICLALLWHFKIITFFWALVIWVALFIIMPILLFIFLILLFGLIALVVVVFDE